MSYHGKQYKGASRDLREQKFVEAMDRLANNRVVDCSCGNRHSTKWAECRDYKASELLDEIFTGGAA